MQEHPDLPVEVYLKNECLPAACTGKADCAGECGCRGDEFCGYTISVSCPTLDDECSHNGDCDGGELCSFDGGQQRWRCLEAAICE